MEAGTMLLAFASFSSARPVHRSCGRGAPPFSLFILSSKRPFAKVTTALFLIDGVDPNWAPEPRPVLYSDAVARPSRSTEYFTILMTFWPRTPLPWPSLHFLFLRRLFFFLRFSRAFRWFAQGDDRRPVFRMALCLPISGQNALKPRCPHRPESRRNRSLRSFVFLTERPTVDKGTPRAAGESPVSRKKKLASKIAAVKNPSQRFARVLHREWWKRYNRTQPKRKNDKKRTGRGGAGTGGGWMRRWGRSRRWRRRLVHGRTKGETLDERSSQSEERGGGGCGWCTKCVCVCVCVSVSSRLLLTTDVATIVEPASNRAERVSVRVRVGHIGTARSRVGGRRRRRRVNGLTFNDQRPLPCVRLWVCVLVCVCARLQGRRWPRSAVSLKPPLLPPPIGAQSRRPAVRSDSRVCRPATGRGGRCHCATRRLQSESATAD